MWNIPLLQQFFSPEILQKIQAIYLNPENENPDEIAWNYSKDGQFTLSSAYDLIKNWNPVIQNQSFNGTWIWKLPIPPKNQVLIWLLLHESVQTKCMLYGRGISLDTNCVLCTNNNETQQHLFRDCSCIKQLWSKLQIPPSASSSFAFHFADWLTINCQSNAVYNQFSLPWKVVFCTALWCIWICRNKALYDKTEPNYTNELLHSLPKRILERSVETVYSTMKKAPNPLNSQCLLVKWNTPQDGWFTLNTDGAVKNNPGLAGAGGLIRDPLGRWVKGFSLGVGVTNSVAAELRGLLEGLKLALQLNISNLVVEMDALTIVNFINFRAPVNPLFKPLVCECRKILEIIPNKVIKHVFREANRCADFLAKMGMQHQSSLSLFCSPPEGVVPLLYFDSSFAVSIRYSSCNILST